MLSQDVRERRGGGGGTRRPVARVASPGDTRGRLPGAHVLRADLYRCFCSYLQFKLCVLNNEKRTEAHMCGKDVCLLPCGVGRVGRWSGVSDEVENRSITSLAQMHSLQCGIRDEFGGKCTSHQTDRVPNPNPVLPGSFLNACCSWNTVRTVEHLARREPGN